MDVRRRAEARVATKRVKKEMEGHTEDPKVVAVAGGKPRANPLTTPLYCE